MDTIITDPATAAALALEVGQRAEAARRTRATIEKDETHRAAGYAVTIFSAHLRDVRREAGRE